MNRTAIKAAGAAAPFEASRVATSPAGTPDAETQKRKCNKRRKAMNKTFVSILCITLVGGTAGCANRTPVLDSKFGDAVRAARTQQTINPNAGMEPDAVEGLDGLAAREAMGRYKDSLRTPPPVTNVINIGGTISGGN